MMKKILHQSPIIVKHSPLHGYGVFATDHIRQDEVVEDCHFIKASVSDREINRYAFYFDEHSTAIILGFGSIYNHSDQPNAKYQFNEATGLITFTATRSIQKGEEILISYGNTWFSDRKLTVKKTPLIKRLLKTAKMPLRAAIIYLGIISLAFILNHLASG